MSKKGLEKFYNEVLPTLKQKYKHTIHYGDVSFDDYDAKCFIKKANGQIEEMVIFDIENLEDSLIKIFTKPVVHMLSNTYRWAEDYGRTWALTKDELVKNKIK